MTTELKPCPFCGSTDIDPEGVLASKDGGENYSYPACNDCSASCEDWNTRTPAKQSTPEELRGAVKWANFFLNVQNTVEIDDDAKSAIETLIHHATRADVEVVTVEDIAMCIQDWKFNEENQQPFFGDYLSVKFPNGLRIVKGGAE